MERCTYADCSSHPSAREGTEAHFWPDPVGAHSTLDTVGEISHDVSSELHAASRGNHPCFLGHWLLPEGKAAPPPLLTNIIAIDRMEIVQGAAGNVDGNWKSLGQAPWVLNPPGCFLRASLIDRMERAGFTPMIAAEIHNMHMQLAFVQSSTRVCRPPSILHCLKSQMIKQPSSTKSDQRSLTLQPALPSTRRWRGTVSVPLWSNLGLRSCCRQIVCVVYRGFQQVFGLAISRQGSRNKLSFRPIQF